MPCSSLLALLLLLAAANAGPVEPETRNSPDGSSAKTSVPLDVCQQGPMKGGALIECEAYIPKYTFNYERGVCEGFIYGGCGGSENLYDTRAACEEKCAHHSRGVREVAKPCSQPEESGRCLALLPRFAYNQASGECRQFMWGGCGGNDNNFRTEAACLAACKPGNEQEEDISEDQPAEIEQN